MRPEDILFKRPEIDIFRIDPSVGFYSEDFSDWSLTPLSGKTLSEALSDAEGVLDGYFLLKGIWIKDDGVIETCYLNLTVPERISDEAYLLVDGEIVRKWKHEVDGDVLPAVAIECTGDYELFYSRRQPAVGIELLKRALTHAKRRAPIAEDLGYILRDENRYEEAIAAFSIVIEEGEPNEYTFSERAGLYEAIGDFDKAELDHQKTKSLVSERMNRFSSGY